MPSTYFVFSEGSIELSTMLVCMLGVSPSLVSGYCEGYSFWSTETANRADSGQLQFWSEPSDILNLRSSITTETVAFTIP